MTKAERQQIRRAMALIRNDEEDGGNYDDGMRILAKLAGYSLEKSRQYDAFKPIDFRTLLRRTNT